MLRAGAETAPSSALRAAVEFTNDVKVILSLPGTVPYVSYAGGVRHVQMGSAPGHPPAPDTGAYRASWRHSEAAEWQVRRGWIAKSWTPSEIGIYLEYGTHNADGSRRMAPRPHVRVVAARWRATHKLAGVVREPYVEAQRRRARELGGRG